MCSLFCSTANQMRYQYTEKAQNPPVEREDQKLMINNQSEEFLLKELPKVLLYKFAGTAFFINSTTPDLS